jgi:hypothetical protein
MIIIARLFQVEFFVLSADLTGFFKSTSPWGWTTKRKGREGILEALRAALWVCVECGLNS